MSTSMRWPFGSERSPRSGHERSMPRELGSAGYSHADASALGARNSVGVGSGHEERIPAVSTAATISVEVTEIRLTASDLLR